MKQVKLPNPPNPDDGMYAGNPLAYNRAMYAWMKETKGKIEIAALNNNTPLDQPFVVTSYVTSTNLTGTNTGTDVTNFLCTLVNSFTNKGIIKSIGVNHE